MPSSMAAQLNQKLPLVGWQLPRPQRQSGSFIACCCPRAAPESHAAICNDATACCPASAASTVHDDACPWRVDEPLVGRRAHRAPGEMPMPCAEPLTRHLRPHDKVQAAGPRLLTPPRAVPSMPSLGIKPHTRPRRLQSRCNACWHDSRDAVLEICAVAHAWLQAVVACFCVTSQTCTRD